MSFKFLKDLNQSLNDSISYKLFLAAFLICKIPECPTYLNKVLGFLAHVSAKSNGPLHALTEKKDVPLLYCLCLKLLRGLSETLDRANHIINQIIDQILIQNLLPVYCVAS